MQSWSTACKPDLAARCCGPIWCVLGVFLSTSGWCLVATVPSCSLCSVLVSSIPAAGRLVSSCTCAMPEWGTSPLTVVTPTVQAMEVLVQKPTQCVSTKLG